MSAMQEHIRIQYDRAGYTIRVMLGERDITNLLAPGGVTLRFGDDDDTGSRISRPYVVLKLAPGAVETLDVDLLGASVEALDAAKETRQLRHQLNRWFQRLDTQLEKAVERGTRRGNDRGAGR